MRYTIYKITNTLNDKFYIGKHQTKNPNDRYFGSGKGIRAAIKLYGKEYFTKTVLFDFDTENEMNSKEKELITETLIADSMSYNMAIGGEGGPHFRGRSHTNETRKTISENRKGKKSGPMSPERLEACRTGRMDKNGSWHASETVEKIRMKAKGRPVTKETKEKLSQANRNRILNGGENVDPLEHSKRMRQFYSDPASKQRLAAAMKGKYKGHIWVVNDVHAIRISPELLEEYFSKGYEKGRKARQK